ncbi:hypothetical protein ACIRCZ_18375 [Leifsonia sp. NPDC102414]|uniref:hypothetical protein n=1 Tax=Leifsonia sp. NPDC102414 TaxID=3364124 RepID=UPI00381C0787
MIQTLVLGLAGGVLVANGIPHFVKGITKEHFPTPFGGSPVVNLVGGWVMLVGGGACLGFADLGGQPVGWVAVAVGALCMGLFHASIGAFGRRD